MYSVGVDPGWKNLGLAVVKKDPESWKSKVVLSRHLCPSAAVTPEKFCLDASNEVFHLAGGIFKIDNVLIERYVSYGNVRSSETENITELIGMLRYSFWCRFESSVAGIDIKMLRAIEWKTSLVKFLSRHYGFQNPSRKMELDKEFSMAAAKFIVINPETITNDHIADAVCLATLPLLERGVDP